MPNSRIAIISSSFPPHQSPEADHMMHLCFHLTDIGYEVDVLTSRGNVPRELPPGVNIHDLMDTWNWSESIRLTKWLYNTKPQAVLLSYLGWIYHFHPMVTFAATMAKIVLPGVPFITQFHNVLGSKPSGNLTTRMLYRLAFLVSGGADAEFGTLLKHSKNVIVFSEHHLKKLEQLAPGLSKKAVLIPPPPILHMSPNDTATRDRTRDKLGIKTNESLIANFGYGYEGKGLETLINAFAVVAKKNKDCKLVLIGRLVEEPVPEGGTFGNRIRQLIAKSGVQDRILMTGGYEADSDEGSVYLRAADICVLPLDSGIQLNNSSLSAALAHGLPVIATCHPQSEKPFIDGKNVLLSPPKDCSALAVNIERVLDDKHLLMRLSEEASELSRTWFSWERAVNETKALLGNCVG